MFITQRSIFVWGVVGVACGVMLVVEAIAIAILLRNTERRFWRRKFVLAATAIGASMVIGAWQAFGVYDTLRDAANLTQSDLLTISQWEGFGNLALCITITLLFVGASYVWMARD